MGKRALRPAVFLDRDGVVNEALTRNGLPFAPSNLAELRITDGAAEALGGLRNAGYALVVVTNQPDVARGTISRSSIDDIHQHLGDRLPLDAFYACFHDESDACDCRKPRPGLLLQAAGDQHLDLAASYLIGDRWKDIDAGWAAGVVPVFIDFGYRERAPTKAPAVTVSSLKVAAQWILNHQMRVNSDSHRERHSRPG
jgi:D-glycero-D-manno-heptose 1,7-bisphosphate phosphatase